MAEKPILFSTPMVRAILDGRKTMTRRVVADKFDPANWDWDIQDKGFGPFIEDKYGDPIEVETLCPYGVPGDRLYVRETWTPYCINKKTCRNALLAHSNYCYKASPEECVDDLRCKWHPSIHMPKSAARIWLTVTDVRVERLQEIATDDAKAEGVLQPGVIPSNTLVRNTEGSIPRTNFKILWDSLNASRGFSWEQNPWVWVISFEREG